MAGLLFPSAQPMDAAAYNLRGRFHLQETTAFFDRAWSNHALRCSF